MALPQDTITGYLAFDADDKGSVVRMKVAKNNQRKDGTKGPALWIKISAFKNAADASRNFRKGDFVVASGRLIMGDDFTKTDGTVLKGEVELLCFHIKLADPKEDDHGSSAARDAFKADAPSERNAREQRSAAKQAPGKMPEPIDDDTSVPF